MGGAAAWAARAGWGLVAVVGGAVGAALGCMGIVSETGVAGGAARVSDWGGACLPCFGWWGWGRGGGGLVCRVAVGDVVGYDLLRWGTSGRFRASGGAGARGLGNAGGSALLCWGVGGGTAGTVVNAAGQSACSAVAVCCASGRRARGCSALLLAGAGRKGFGLGNAAALPCSVAGRKRRVCLVAPVGATGLACAKGGRCAGAAMRGVVSGLCRGGR